MIFVWFFFPLKTFIHLITFSYFEECSTKISIKTKCLYLVHVHVCFFRPYKQAETSRKARNELLSVQMAEEWLKALHLSILVMSANTACMLASRKPLSVSKPSPVMADGSCGLVAAEDKHGGSW